MIRGMRVIVGYLAMPSVEPGTIVGPHTAGGYLCTLAQDSDANWDVVPVGYATIHELATARARGLAGDVRSVAEHRLLDAGPADYGRAMGQAIKAQWMPTGVDVRATGIVDPDVRVTSDGSHG